MSGSAGRHVFLCYAREDSARVDRLERLLKAAGVRVWRDTDDLWPGQDWRIHIRRAITDGALVFLACFSQAWRAAGPGFRNEELLLAAEQARLRRTDDSWLIPVRLDDCALPDLDLGAGRTLDSLQRADLFGPGTEAAEARLIEAVRMILGIGPDDDGLDRRTGTGQARKPRLFWLVLAYLLPVLGLWFLGFPALLALMLKRNRLIRVNAMQAFGISLVLLPQIIAYYLLGSTAQDPAVDHLIVVLYTIGYTTFGVLLLWCLIQVARHRQPRIVGLSAAAAWLASREHKSRPPRRRKPLLWTMAVLVPLGLAAGLILPRFLSADSAQAPARTLRDPSSYGVYADAFSPAGQYLAACDGNGITYLWDVKSQTILATLPDPGSAVNLDSVAFAPDGRTLAVGDNSGYAYLWNVGPGRLAAIPAIPRDYGVASVAFSPDGQTLAIGDHDGSTYLWSIATRKVTAILPDPRKDSSVESVAFDSSGKYLAVGDATGITYVWNIAARSIAAALPDPGNEASVNSVAFRPGRDELAAGDGSGNTYLWNIARKSIIAIFTDPAGFVNSVAFSPDGAYLAAGDANGSTYLWSVASERPVSTFSDPRSRGVQSVAFSPKGTTLAAGDENGYTYIWRVPARRSS